MSGEQAPPDRVGSAGQRQGRSEEGRVGEEGRSRGWPDHLKKKKISSEDYRCRLLHQIRVLSVIIRYSDDSFSLRSWILILPRVVSSSTDSYVSCTGAVWIRGS